MRKTIAVLILLFFSYPVVAQQDVTVPNEPCGGFPVAAKSTGTTGAVTATLTANANSTLYICRMDVSAVGGTAAVGPITLTGTLGGTLTYQLNSAAAPVNQSWTFTPCWPASGPNVNLVLLTTADGTATAVDIDMLGCMK